jgi:hypothetical protein
MVVARPFDFPDLLVSSTTGVNMSLLLSVVAVVKGTRSQLKRHETLGEPPGLRVNDGPHLADQPNQFTPRQFESPRLGMCLICIIAALRFWKILRSTYGQSEIPPWGCLAGDQAA